MTTRPHHLDTPIAVPDWSASNAVRLCPRDWLIVAAVVAAVVCALPATWRSVEPFAPDSDYRQPFALSNDYWMYNRLVTDAIDRRVVVVIGDSVIWGEYVRPGETLTAALNAGSPDADARFVNAGLNGAHPLALWGLVNHYAADLHDRPVVLHLNLLWMSSSQRDLSDPDSDTPFNHPGLIPQLWPAVPMHRASASDRIAAAIDNRLPARWWVNHLRTAYLDGLDLHSWTIEHPYTDPLSVIRLTPPQPSDDARHGDQPLSWLQRGIEPQDMPWVDLDDSLQWLAFRRTVELLRQRGNRVFVIVGPLNAHMLTTPSRDKLDPLTRSAERWLTDQNVPFDTPPLLPSEEYGDASHPLAVGYARLARHLADTPAFSEWLAGP